MLAFILWQPRLEMFHLFGWPVRWYSMCWCVGLLLAFFIVQWLYRNQKIAREKFDPLFFYCFFGVLIGARLGHCLFYEPGYFLSHPLEMILPMRHTDAGWRFTGYEGLASHGGAIGLMLALWLYVRKYGVNLMRVLDDIALAAPLTGAFIRLGNLFNSEIVGRATDVPWGFIFINNGEHFARHPSQLYEAVAYLIIFGVGMWLYGRHRERAGTGFFFGLCLTLVFSFRFFVEFFKDVQESFEQGLPIDMGQILSLPFIALGLYCLLGGKWCRRLAEKPDTPQNGARKSPHRKR